MKQILVTVVMAMLLAVSSEAQAGTSTHGGHGIRLNGKLYLLDLVEAGVEQDPQFSNDVLTDPYFLDALQTGLGGIDAPLAKLGSKIEQIRKTSQALAGILTLAIRTIDWRKVNSALLRVPDDRTPIDVGGQPLLQLAIRQGRAVLIDRTLWSELSEEHKVALILHEAIYAFCPGLDKNGQCQSAMARNLNGSLFTRRYANAKWEDVDNLASGVFGTMTWWAQIFRLNKSNFTLFSLDADFTASSYPDRLVAQICSKLEPRDQSYYVPIFKVTATRVSIEFTDAKNEWGDSFGFERLALKMENTPVLADVSGPPLKDAALCPSQINKSLNDGYEKLISDKL